MRPTFEPDHILVAYQGATHIYKAMDLQIMDLHLALKEGGHEDRPLHVCTIRN